MQAYSGPMPLAWFTKIVCIHNIFIGKDDAFPEELISSGLSESVMMSIYEHVKFKRIGAPSWRIQSNPNVGFYYQLHHFLKRWSVTACASKALIGDFYLAIDPSLQAKGFQSNNAYRFIERVISSGYTASTLIPYNHQETKIKKLQSTLKGHASQMENLTSEFSSVKEELQATKQELERAKEELKSTRHTLKDVTNMLKNEKKQHSKALTCEQQHTACFSDCALLESDLYDAIQQNTALSTALTSVQAELASIKDTNLIYFDEDTASFTFKTTTGTTKYLPNVRKLYYTLLADQIPPSKIINTIKAVLKCFLPSINVDHLKLPKERCAGYMRREELKTISMAHKATLLDSAVSIGATNMNTDGTTKLQKKLNATAINGIVLSVNEVADGTADSIIRDVSKQLQSLRETAEALELPNANKINWTMVASSTSDSASTQKRLNKLIQEKIDEDENIFGVANQDSLGIVENFCSMHLGTNLRKAFLEGIKSPNNDQPGEREHHVADVLVHEFCKLFGKYGTPEYGCGVLSFPDFLELKAKEHSGKDNYYLRCANTTLERQIGSRYFVSAANSAKILYLRAAAIEFLEYSGKHSGNKLEREVYHKLQDEAIVSQLRADSLMFYHVYADLVMLSKSTHLNKNAYSMNQHYLELKVFLQKLEQDPELVMDKGQKVFESEQQLYSNDKKLNHRLHSKSEHVHHHLFTTTDEENKLLFPFVASGAAAMKTKLCNYAKNQLPGGKYWNPKEETKKILKSLKPSNDLCESILGLNDYLTTALPNLHQMTKSNLTEMKKNKTIPWLNEQPQSIQGTLIDMACNRKGAVMKDYRAEEEHHSMQRRERMLLDKSKRDALQARRERERSKLSTIHLIANSEELTRTLAEIDDQKITLSKKS